MRELRSNDRNILTVNDARSGSEIEVYYRNPTPREEALYQAKLVRKKGKKVLINSFETRMRFGLRIMTGFRDGDFGVDGKPISSKPESPNYYEGWKKVIEEGAADIVRVLGGAVFEGVRVDGDTGIDIETEEEEAAGEEEPPLGKS